MRTLQNRAFLILLLLAASPFGVCSHQTPITSPQFKDAKLGFRYTPPPDMEDTTEIDRENIRSRAAARGTTNILNLLLSLRSPGGDASPDWHSIGIETYPRERVGAQDDREASLRFSRAVAGKGQEVGVPTEMTVGDFGFVVSSFELQEGQLTKRARVYTTVRKGLMLSIAFSANSQKTLDSIASSMKTFTPQNFK